MKDTVTITFRILATMLARLKAEAEARSTEYVTRQYTDIIRQVLAERFPEPKKGEAK